MESPIIVYVVYSILGNPEIHKRTVMGKDSFDFTVKMAREMGNIATVIHSDSTVATDPILDVAIITEEKPNPENIRALNQTCIDFLVDSGYGRVEKKGIVWNFKKLRDAMAEYDEEENQ